MIPSILETLVTDGVVDEVIQQIKSGKEADVFLVRKGEGLLAAKVYKERERRNFKNNAGYKEGRQARSSRDQRAMDKGSRFGREMSEDAWKSAEADALFKLHAVGARVPTPDVFYEGVLVMALVVDAEGRPAPRLADTRLSVAQALELQKELLKQIVLMLTCDLIHGDLSAFNVLIAHDGPTIIDLPQVVAAAHNTRAEAFLRRDVTNLTKYLGQFAPEILARPDGGSDIWGRYMRGELFAGYVPDMATLREDVSFLGFRRERNRRRGRGPGLPGEQRAPRGGAPVAGASTPAPAAPAPSAPPPPVVPAMPLAPGAIAPRREYRPPPPVHRGGGGPRHPVTPSAPATAPTASTPPAQAQPGNRPPGNRPPGNRPPRQQGPGARPNGQPHHPPGAQAAGGHGNGTGNAVQANPAPAHQPGAHPNQRPQGGPPRQGGGGGGPPRQGGGAPRRGGGPPRQGGAGPPQLGGGPPAPGGAPRPDGNPHRRRRRRFN